MAIAIQLKRSSRMPFFAGVALTVAMTMSGARAAEPVLHESQPVKPAKKDSAPRWYQIGRASWYGKLFQGHQTASGENYDMNGLTCAHRSLPLGTLLRVTNLRNHKTVVVRVNDRGPLPSNRVIDLSFAAARFLDFGGRGTAPVRLDVIDRSELAQLQWPGNSSGALSPR